VPDEIITFLAFTMISLLVRPSVSKSPVSFLAVHTPFTPIALVESSSSNITWAILNPSTICAPARAASGRKETAGPCLSLDPQPSIQCPQ
jgi:hypothetical protein